MTYAEHAHDYRRAGWAAPLWLPPGAKTPPPAGYTGHDGAWPSPADIQTWTEDHPDANIALRLPEDTIGLDVDAWGDKPGAQTLADLENELGPLPPTLLTTSRQDGISGIRLYRVPPQPAWPNQAGPGIEMIHLGHRYAIVWPSTHPTAGTYKWVDQRTGEILNHIPTPDQLPELPPAWVDHLQQRATKTADKHHVDNQHITHWLGALRRGTPCDKVHTAAAAAIEELTNGSGASRHDTMTVAAARLIGYGAWGHAGADRALTDLHAAFMQVAVGPGHADRDTDTAASEWRRAIAGAVAMHTTEHPTPLQNCSCPLPPFDPNVENAFWNSRPQLAHIREFARARRCSPWAVLGVALTRIIVKTPPEYVLPAIIGGNASLNLFCGIVAPSGGGKGAAESAAADAVNAGDVHTAGVGSGEGILHQYARYVKPKNQPGYIEQHNDACLFTAGEVDTLEALHSRQSSTLVSELRKVYMGEELSFAYVDPTKRLKVAKHAYRAGLIVGIQPARAGVLLSDTDGGTPQRFVWMPGTDPDMPDEAPQEPTPITWNLPVYKFTTPAGTSGKNIIRVCDTARKTIDAEHVKRNRGEGNALDGHALLTRLKWAAALGLLDGRLEVSEDDWQLASTIMQMSDHTRNRIIADLKAKEAKANKAQGEKYAEREKIKEERVVEEGEKRVSRWIMHKLDGEWVRASALRRKLASRDRGFFDSAVDRLSEAGQIEVREADSGQPGTLLRKVEQ